MTHEGLKVLIAILGGFLFFGFLLYKLWTDRDFSARFGETSRMPWSYWGGEDSGAAGLLYLMVPVMFLLFSCLLCFFLLQLFRSLM